jgi:hypothetical protein
VTADQTYAGDEIPAATDVIEVHVSELTQIFNSLDPSPFHDKDLDDDADEFIVGWAKELPRQKPLALRVHLDKPAVTAEMARALSEAVHAFYSRRATLASQRLRELFRVGRTALVIGLAFLAVFLFVGNRIVKAFPGSGAAEIIQESLVIGGWVAMWRPLEIFLYEWVPIRRDRKLFDRLKGMAVRIVCPGSSPAGRARTGGSDPSVRK